MKTNWLNKINFQNPTLIVLIVTNLYPLYGVLFLDWKLFALYLVYSFELFIILFYSFLKVLLSLNFVNKLNYRQQSTSPFYSKLKIAFIDFGLFTLYAMFFVMIWVLFLYFAICVLTWDQHFGVEIANASDFPLQIVLLPSILFFLSHGYSFITNFIFKKEYQTYIKKSFGDSILKNIVIFIIILCVASFVISHLKSSIYTLILFVIIKCFWDIYRHIKEHNPNTVRN